MGETRREKKEGVKGKEERRREETRKEKKSKGEREREKKPKETEILTDFNGRCSSPRICPVSVTTQANEVGSGQ